MKSPIRVWTFGDVVIAVVCLATIVVWLVLAIGDQR